MNNQPGATKPSIADIEERLRAAFPDAEFAVQDDSHLHAGHAGNTGGGHYRLLVVSEAFSQQSRLARQRLVKDKLHDLFPHRIHALSIKAASPEEYFHHSE